MCTPVDNDYIMAILNFKKKQTLTLLKQEHFEEFLNEEYFTFIIGDMREVLKGTAAKVFALKHDEELVRSVSNSLILFNKKTL